MAKYCKYYKQQKRVSHDGGLTWQNVDEYRIGDLIENNSIDCGYHLERWVTVDGGYECDGYDKYTQEKLQLSYNEGSTWIDSNPLETRRGSFIEHWSLDCGYVPLERWVTVDGGYECDGYDKYTQEKLQLSYDGGSTYVDSNPLETRKGNLIEKWSVDCGYYPHYGLAYYIETCGRKSMEGEGIYDCKLNCEVGGIVRIRNEKFCRFDSLASRYLLGDDYMLESLSTTTDGVSYAIYYFAIRKISTDEIVRRYAFDSRNHTDYSNIEWNLVYLSGEDPNAIFTFDIDILGLTKEVLGYETTATLYDYECLHYEGGEESYYCTNLYIKNDYGSSFRFSYTLDETEETYECNGISSVSESEIPKGIESVEVGDCITTINNNAFKNCTSLIRATFSNSVTSMGTEIFRNCINLTNVVMPNSIPSITSSMFSGCTVLQNITIPNSVTTIGNSAFSSCSSLTSITIPNSVTTIGNSAFSSCSSLTSITIPNSVTTIGNSAFSSCSSLTSITIPNSVIDIDDSAFIGCSSLTSVTIPSSVTSIDNFTFSGCTSLASVTISNGVTTIGREPFSKCTSLTSITIPNSVTSIGTYAFDDCASLTSVTIGNGIKTIGTYAFRNCSNLTSVTCLAITPPRIGSDSLDRTVFEGTSANMVIYVPNESVENYKIEWERYADRIQPIS